MGLKDLVNQISEAYKTVARDGQSEICNEAQKLFVKFPELKVITWNQYTPYFNDGNTCEFSVNEIFGYASVNEKDDPEELEHVWGHDMEEFANLPGDHSNKELCKAFEEFMDLIFGLEDLAKTIFGDHAQIRITRTGVEIQTFEHY